LTVKSEDTAITFRSGRNLDINPRGTIKWSGAPLAFSRIVIGNCAAASRDITMPF
jgi:hypothetical protein